MQRTEPCAEGMKCRDVKVQGTSCKVGVGVGWGGSGDITDFLSTFSSRFTKRQGCWPDPVAFLVSHGGNSRPSLPVL